METQTMGKILVQAKIENLVDLWQAAQGKIPGEQIRKIEVLDAMIDTGATNLSMPKRMIEQLGLMPFRTRPARMPTGWATLRIYGGVRLTVQGRECSCDVAEIADDCPVLIGVIPLEALDFVIDPSAQRLVGNPDHGGEHMIDMF
jgi:predicted aspartyl protease